MGVASKYNKVNRFTFQVTGEMPFTSLKELEGNYPGKEHKINSMYISHSGKYGDAPVYITDENFVNIPSHLLESTKQMLNDEEFVEAVNSGKVGFTIYTYQSNGKECYSVNFVDL